MIPNPSSPPPQTVSDAVATAGLPVPRPRQDVRSGDKVPRQEQTRGGALLRHLRVRGGCFFFVEKKILVGVFFFVEKKILVGVFFFW